MHHDNRYKEPDTRSAKIRGNQRQRTRNPEERQWTSTPTRAFNAKALLIYVTYVLISTLTLCIYTHHNARTPMITTTLYPSSYLSLIPSLHSYPIHCRSTTSKPACSPQKRHSPNYHLFLATTTNHPPKLHQILPPRSARTPRSTRPPLPPTHHQTTHTWVSMNTCTQQTPTITKKHAQHYP